MKSFKQLCLGAFLALCSVELTSAVLSVAFRSKLRFYDEADFIAPLKGFEHAADIFDRELGWAPNFSTDYGERNCPNHDRAPFISLFGDSFTFGEDVNADQTWGCELAARAGVGVLNFGVLAYGPDQALLRFESIFPEIRSAVVILSIIPENVNRLLNVYRRFYFPRHAWPLTKPRFVLEGDRLKLLSNPISSVNEFSKLRDPNFLRAIGQNDFWYNREGYPVFGFPFSKIIINQRLLYELWAKVQGRNLDDLSPRPWTRPWRNEEGLAIMKAISLRFAQVARSFGARPIIAILPQHITLEDCFDYSCPGDSEIFFRFCHEQGLECIDVISALRDVISQRNDIRPLFGASEHYSIKGNQLIAQIMHGVLMQRDVLAKSVSTSSLNQSSATEEHHNQ